MESIELVEAWRATLSGHDKPWVLFTSGTCVVLTEPGSDLTAQAQAILREFGPAGEGSAIGDFGTSIATTRRPWRSSDSQNGRWVMYERTMPTSS